VRPSRVLGSSSTMSTRSAEAFDIRFFDGTL
jgi:hypothetical protein